MGKTGNSDVAATALIAQESGQATRYGLNDTLPGEATLVAIHPFYVVLRRAGELEALRFVASPTTAETASASPTVLSTTAKSSGGAPAAASASHATPAAVVMTNDQIRDALRQRALALQNTSPTDASAQ